jgi:apolipoprotein N-acyltransferase
MIRDYTIRHSENFLCAGSSALLVAVAQLHPEYWYASLFALIPFLWRVIRAGLPQAIVLGAMLATSYTFVALPAHAWVTPGAFVFQLLGLNLLFAFYAIVVNRIGKHIGFNAVFIAALWLPLEYALSHYAGLGSLFALSADESGLLVRIGSLFGMLMISFVVVLVNTVILIFLRHAAQALLCKSLLVFKDKRKTYLSFKEILFETRRYYFPSPRAPPLSV